MVYVLLYILAIIAGVSKAIADICSAQTFFGSKLERFGFKYNWWHRSYSSFRKWRDGIKERGEAFFGSSTFLVWVTDGWHLMDAIRNVSFLCIGLIAPSLFDGIAVFLLSLAIFELTYNYLKK